MPCAEGDQSEVLYPGNAKSGLLRTVLMDIVRFSACSSTVISPDWTGPEHPRDCLASMTFTLMNRAGDNPDECSVNCSSIMATTMGRTEVQLTLLTMIQSRSIILKSSRGIFTIPKLCTIFCETQRRYANLLHNKAGGDVAGTCRKDEIIWRP